MIALADRYRGCLLGLACGDAVGTTVEFSPRGSFEPLTDMVGGGPFELLAGQWTDDTSMALCLASSLLHCGGFDAVDQMNRYVNWWHWGYYSATNECFDIGMTVAKALQNYQVTQDPMSGSTDPQTAGNGALMRLAPAVLAYHPWTDEVMKYARLSSQTTHGAPEALDCSALFGEVISRALSGLPKEHLLQADRCLLSTPATQALKEGRYLDKPKDAIVGSGYCVESLEAALWCFAKTNSFLDAVLLAANLGDDADTTAAIVGQLAGAHYGVAGIPSHWLQRLHMRGEIERLALALYDQASARKSSTPVELKL